MYRETSDHPGDSGWRVFAGDETGDPGSIAIVPPRDLVAKDARPRTAPADTPASRLRTRARRPVRSRPATATLGLTSPPATTGRARRPGEPPRAAALPGILGVWQRQASGRRKASGCQTWPVWRNSRRGPRRGCSGGSLTARAGTRAGSCAGGYARAPRPTTWTGRPGSRTSTSGPSTPGETTGRFRIAGAERPISDRPGSAGIQATRHLSRGGASISLAAHFPPRSAMTRLPSFAPTCHRLGQNRRKPWQPRRSSSSTLPATSARSYGLRMPAQSGKAHRTVTPARPGPYGSHTPPPDNTHSRNAGATDMAPGSVRCPAVRLRAQTNDLSCSHSHRSSPLPGARGQWPALLCVFARVSLPAARGTRRRATDLLVRSGGCQFPQLAEFPHVLLRPRKTPS